MGKHRMQKHYGGGYPAIWFPSIRGRRAATASHCLFLKFLFITMSYMTSSSVSLEAACRYQRVNWISSNSNLQWTTTLTIQLMTQTESTRSVIKRTWPDVPHPQSCWIALQSKIHLGSFLQLYSWAAARHHASAMHWDLITTCPDKLPTCQRLAPANLIQRKKQGKLPWLSNPFCDSHSNVLCSPSSSPASQPSFWTHCNTQ